MIEIFYACDNNFLKYTAVSIRSLIEHTNKNNSYKIHILHTDITNESMAIIMKMKTSNVDIEFNDVSMYLDSIADSLPIRDYYTKTTYYRLFIATMFPDISKAIYIDSDTIVLDDIAKLYAYELERNLVGACNEQVMIQEDVYGNYVERVVGIDRHQFFNAGLLLINCELFREKNILFKFTKLLAIYEFKVTQDEDYLNVLCKDRVLWLPQKWNTEVFGQIPIKEENIKIIHYIMTSKPWHYKECRLKEYFLKYAQMTSFYNDIIKTIDSYSDEKKELDALSGQKLMETAIFESAREDSYFQLIKNSRSKDREEILEKIERLESEGRFQDDVEHDPITIPLNGGVDYLTEKFSTALKAKLALFLAKRFISNKIRHREFVIEEIKGLENMSNLSGGAVVTCNHFNALDSFAIHLAYLEANTPQKRLYRVIREGNYTNFKGFYGYLMRNCYTLPLSSSYQNMKQMMLATNKLLHDGHLVLFYPEQSMWWNYRKPKPLQSGAFRFAVANNVPVLPCFITMRDGEKIDSDGYPIQEYTINIGKPIYPIEGISFSAGIEHLKHENYAYWKEVYESFYGIPLKYNIKP